MVYAIDPKTKEKKKAKFVKSGAICVVRIAVEKPICIEPFDRVPQVRWAAAGARGSSPTPRPRPACPRARVHHHLHARPIHPPNHVSLAQLGRFTLRDEGKTVAIGKVLKVPKRGSTAAAE